MYACALSPADPDLALSGGGDDRALLWRLSTGEVLFVFGGHADSVSAVAFSSDGKLAAVGGMDGRVNVWDVATGELSVSLEGPDEVVVRLRPPRIWRDSHARSDPFCTLRRVLARRSGSSGTRAATSCSPAATTARPGCGAPRARS